MTEETLFAAALEKGTPAERAAFLEDACGGDAVLRRRVEALLASHEEAGFLRTPAVQCAVERLGAQGSTWPTEAGAIRGDDPVCARDFANDGRTSDRPIALAEQSGTLIGRYKLLQLIGEGGMGTVYMAEQTHPVRRKVALKLIKAGMDTRLVIARFEAERQALALMDHPNIARVLDAGATDSGRPYFVMELVKGVPITCYCDELRLTPRQRLELFIPVCQAVQHAHQKGIIHRDLKPSNVLIAPYDGEPVPKVIDFGVAKATGPRLTERTVYTEFGSVVGTLEYMSPEQAELNQLDVDTRSDIYSLGVLLYELLTGTTPLQRKRLDRASLLDALRIIREEEPTRPSTRLSTTEELPSIAASRGVEPRRLSGMVRGELDWIVMKALEKDRTRRYETANSFALDLRRYLADEPVQACPPSAAYQLRKIARRHRTALAMGGVIAGLLVASVVNLAFSNYRIHEKQREVTGALGQTRREKREKSEQLWQALVSQARANRLSRRAGQRFETLEILRRATELARTLNLPDDKFMEMRNSVIATLALPDMQLTGPWNPWPGDGYRFDFDESHSRYARTDRQGNCSIRRVEDDGELYRLPGLGIPYLSRDGRFVAVVGHDAEQKDVPGAQLWQLDGTTPRRILSEIQARAVDFHHNGQHVAIANTDGSLGLFELPSGRRLSRLAPEPGLRRELVIALHPSESLVAVTSYFGSVVQVRDVRTGNVVTSLPQGSRPNSVAWLPDGRTLAVGLAEAHSIRLYDRATFQPFRTLDVGDTATWLAFNHAGDRLATCGWGSRVALFDVGTGQQLFATTWVPAATMRFSPDDRGLAGAVEDGQLGISRVADSREYRTLSRKGMPEKTYSMSVSVSPDGRLLAAAMPDGFGLWDLAGGSELAFIPTGGKNNSVVFEPTGALLVLCPKGLFRWPIADQSGVAGERIIGPPERLPLPSGSSLARSRDGRIIVTSSRAAGHEQPFAGGWILHSDRPGAPIRIDAGADILGIAVSPDGRWMVTVTQHDGVAKLWDARDGRLVKQVAEYGAVYPSFSPDGRWLSANLHGGRLLEVETGKPGTRVGSHGTFAPDGKLIAVPTTSGVIRLVDPATGRELAALGDPHRSSSYSPVFTADGTSLIAFGDSKGIRVWDLRLIRQQLAEMELDWDAPRYPSAGPITEAGRPLKVKVDLGDPAQFVLAREEHARRCIDHYRRVLEKRADSPEACNELAWVYVTAPEVVRDVKAAVPLAEKAVRLEPGNTTYVNTLGVAYYRAGRYREAIATLRPNLDKQEDQVLPFDLYFLAMSHQRLGETDRARVYLDLAVRWMGRQRGLSATHLEELELFRAEAEDLMKHSPRDTTRESRRTRSH